MKDFLLANYKLLIMIAVLILELILFLLKKRPQVNYSDHIKSLIDEFAPAFINLAELSKASGSEKMSFVVQQLLDKCDKFILPKDRVYWTDYIVSKVESILSTPQKKGK